MKLFNKINILLIGLCFTAPSVLAQTSVQNVPIVSVETQPIVAQSQTTAPQNKQQFSVKKRNSFGLTAHGYFDINSDYSRLYVNFPTTNINTAGFGFALFYEMGLSDKFSGEISLGYSRLVYASRNRTVIKENFIVADLVAHYHFLNDDNNNLYGILGLGGYVSARSAVPTLDVGVGNHFKLTENLSIKAEFVYKTAIVLNRFELRGGIAYHF